jgi:hypothetical protein
VFDVLDYYKHNWAAAEIAHLFDLTTRQVDAAIEYIEANTAEVMEVYQSILDRHARGNPPELQGKFDAGHANFLAKVRELREPARHHTR